MPLTRLSADAFGVVTISLVSLLILLGFLCILYSFFFHSRVCRRGFSQLRYFGGPWVVRIIFVLFAIWWGFGEVARLSLWRHEGRVTNALNLKWQETICKCYIVSNLGFAEPCLFLTLSFLLSASSRQTESGVLSRQWNLKTVGYVLLYCLPVFILQLFVILIGPQLNKYTSHSKRLPHYFTMGFHVVQGHDGGVICTYPLMNTIVLGVFATILTAYLAWLGRKILKLVINKWLKKRVYALIFSVSSCLLLRVLLLGLSVLPKPENFLFEALAFFAFLALLCCIGVCILVLVYFPTADSLALGNLQDLEASRTGNDHNETISLIAANQSHTEENVGVSPGTDSGISSMRRSISFHNLEKDGTSGGTFVELSLFSPRRDTSRPGSPPLMGWPMHPPIEQQQPHGPLMQATNKRCFSNFVVNEN